ncbi:hypothetical protein [Sinomonas sp. ASV322]|uniref:hypothetical protein n=1 Tax=Sinomonas sp. ASV322 TaxID=3041920 RepID=UPI0027DD8117|nr:hypothetical protein [Sinomonas sp. ASV322]MDQ4502774.1 hypothetical protein [Sinomonas sp. ASV322]
MSSTLAAVTRTAGVLWVRELAGLFRTTTKTILWAAGGGLGAALALGLVLAMVAAQSAAGPIPRELGETMLRTVGSRPVPSSAR